MTSRCGDVTVEIRAPLLFRVAAAIISLEMVSDSFISCEREGEREREREGERERP